MHETNKRMKPDLNLLSVFDAVARFGSVTAAADRLNLSQPAVSHAMNRLRATVGDPLFTRDGRGLAPTPLAIAMLAPVRDVLVAATALLSPRAFSPENEETVFRIGASDYAALTIVPQLVNALQRRALRVTLDILPVGSGTLRQLQDGSLDTSFWGTQPPGKPFHYLGLFQEHYRGVARSSHPVFGKAGNGRVTLPRYLDYPHVVVSLRNPGANEVDQALARLGKARRVGLTSHSFAGSMASLKNSDLIATLPSRLCQLDIQNGLRIFALPLEIPRYSYGLLWHQRTDAALAHSWLRRMIAGVCQAKHTD